MLRMNTLQDFVFYLSRFLGYNDGGNLSYELSAH